MSSLSDTTLSNFLAAALAADLLGVDDKVIAHPFEEYSFFQFSKQPVPAMETIRILIEDFFAATFGKIHNVLVTSTSVTADLRFPGIDQEHFWLEIGVLLKEENMLYLDLASTFGTCPVY